MAVADAMRGYNALVIQLGEPSECNKRARDTAGATKEKMQINDKERVYVVKHTRNFSDH